MRRAYQLLIREEQRRLRTTRMHFEVLDCLQRNGGGFAKPQRRKQRLVLPTEIEGTTDRTTWSQKIGEFYRSLYDPDDLAERERVFSEFCRGWKNGEKG